ncbi:MAG: transglutaminase family protein [Azospirillum sp.]|nr:transglutaminase family protein [Azospirillum sp.]
MRYRTRHVTRYDYGEEVPVSHHLVHLAPRSHPRQRCRKGTVSVEGKAAARADYADYFGNPTTYFALQEPHRGVVITAEIEVEVAPPPLFAPAATPPWERLRAEARALAGGEDEDGIGQYAFDSVLVEASRDLAEYALPSFPGDRPIGLALAELTLRIHRDFTFDPTATTTTTPLAEVLKKRRGVCQDFAHLGVGCLRSLGLPARYVSGYLRTLPPPGKPRLIGADMSHAWFSGWCGDDTWVDLCPTNGRLVDTDFITVGWGRDYDDVCPVRGVILGGARHTLKVSVDVEAVDA